MALFTYTTTNSFGRFWNSFMSRPASSESEFSPRPVHSPTHPIGPQTTRLFIVLVGQCTQEIGFDNDLASDDSNRVEKSVRHENHPANVLVIVDSIPQWVCERVAEEG
jgi:hypothetical protein